MLILITFAAGGSLTGYAGRKILHAAGIENTALFVLLYIVVITLLWPLSVLTLSIPLGQFPFFKDYIRRIGKKLIKDKKVTSSASSLLSHRKQASATSLRHITIFASGAGSNAARIIDHFRGSTKARVSLVVCNKPGAGVIAIAKKEGIPVLIIEKERFFRGDAYLPELQAARTDLIVLAGFLWKVPQNLIDAYARRIVNIHPALLPKFGGRGMYGQYVHQSVLHAGEMESGITIHYVDAHYDNGDVIFQTACPVLEGDTANTLAQRIHALEHMHYPAVIEQLLLSTND